jgi:hypothetical protein
LLNVTVTFSPIISIAASSGVASWKVCPVSKVMLLVAGSMNLILPVNWSATAMNVAAEK